MSGSAETDEGCSDKTVDDLRPLIQSQGWAPEGTVRANKNAGSAFKLWCISAFAFGPVPSRILPHQTHSRLRSLKRPSEQISTVTEASALRERRTPLGGPCRPNRNLNLQGRKGGEAGIVNMAFPSTCFFFLLTRPFRLGQSGGFHP
jgi:hypothetical protein